MADPRLAAALAISPATGAAEVVGAAALALEADEVPWPSRLQGMMAVLWRSLPEPLSQSLYVPAPAGIRLVLAAHQGAPAPLAADWHQGLVGTAAGDRVVQIVPVLRMFHGHGLANPAAESALAVPVTRRSVRAVLCLTALQRDAFSPVEVELVQAVAEAAAERWPDAGEPGGAGG